MKIKTKLTVAIGTLFILIAILSVVAVFYINALSNDTNNILEANYNSLDYSKKMLIALDALPNDSDANRKLNRRIEFEFKSDSGEVIKSEEFTK